MDIYERYGRQSERLEEQLEATQREFAAHVSTINVLRHLKNGELSLDQLTVDPTEPSWNLTLLDPRAAEPTDTVVPMDQVPVSLSSRRNGHQAPTSSEEPSSE